MGRQKISSIKCYPLPTSKVLDIYNVLETNYQKSELEMNFVEKSNPNKGNYDAGKYCNYDY